MKHDIEGIVNEINANYDLKGTVKTVVESFHIRLFIDFVKVSIIHVKLLFKLKPDVVRGQSVKEFRQDDEPVLISLRKQSNDVLITDLIQQYFMHYIYKKNSV